MIQQQFAYCFAVIEKEYSKEYPKGQPPFMPPTTVCNIGLEQQCGIIEAANFDEATGKVHRLAHKLYKGKEIYVKIGHPLPGCIVSDVDCAFIKDL